MVYFNNFLKQKTIVNDTNSKSNSLKIVALFYI